MNRTERLLDLVALLLDAHRPLTFAQLRAAFPGEYEGAVETAERKFERDKAELLEIGIPVAWSPPTAESPAGYVLDRDAYYLPDAGLTADEVAVLFAAGSAALASGAFPGSQDLGHALRKLGFLADGPTPAPQVRVELAHGPRAEGLAARLDALWAAISARKSVELEYFSPGTRALTRRTVDPWALVLRRGQWALVGHCHLRQAPRTFLVHRVQSVTPNPTRPRTPDFEAPVGLDVSAHVGHWPWQHAFHAPVEVTVALRGALWAHAASLFPGCAVATGEAGATVTVRATHTEGLLRYLLSLGAEAKVASPADVQAQLVALARRLVAQHEAGAAP